jgi:hypothetical protein
MEETTLFVKVNDLERLEYLCQLSGRHIRVDVQNLALRSLCQTCQDWQCARPDGTLDRFLVNLGDLAYEAVFLAVEILGLEYSSGYRTCTCAKLLESLDKLKVFRQEDFAGNFKSLGVGVTNAVCILGYNSSVLEKLVELRLL